MAPDADAELALLRAEVARLRSLVGPLERSHEDLRRDVADARAAVGGAEAEAERLRGQLAELDDHLAGAREIEVAVRRMSAGPLLRTARRAGRIGHRRRGGSVAPAEPRFSVLTLVGGPEARHLRACIESVRAQTVADWEHVLVVDASAASSVMRTLDEAAAEDRRVRVAAVARAASQQRAALGLAAATGELVAFVDHTDRLEPDALAEMSAAMAEGVDVAYSDHDVIDAAGFYVDPVYKPDFSPERLRSQNYVTRLVVARRSLLDVVGGFRDGLEGAEDHDLILRLTEAAGSVAHVPRVLYHCRQSAPSGLADPASPWATAAGARAVADHCARSGIDAAVETTRQQGCYRVVRRVAARPLVSVVIPTRGSTGRVWGVDRCFVVEAVRSLLDASTYREMEVVVVHDIATPGVVLDALTATSPTPISLVPFDGPFNFSAKVNLGVSAARGDLILLLNDDTQLIEPSSVEVLVGHLARPGVVMAGAKLLFADGTMQHGGHVYAQRPEHLCMGWRGDSPGPGPLWPLAVERECSGVTAACALVRRDDFEAVGGFTTELPMNYNDVDFCLKVRATGRRIIWSPWAVVVPLRESNPSPRGEHRRA